MIERDHNEPSVAPNRLAPKECAQLIISPTSHRPLRFCESAKVGFARCAALVLLRVDGFREWPLSERCAVPSNPYPNGSNGPRTTKYR